MLREGGYVFHTFIGKKQGKIISIKSIVTSLISI